MQESYTFNFGVINQYSDVLLQAGKFTLLLAVLTIVLGSVIGLLLALLRTSGIKGLYHIVSASIEIIRAVPPLVFIVWIYYCVPIFIGVSLTAFQTAVLALAVYSAAFYAEIFRAGLQSIEKGYLEAAYSVGMTKVQSLRRITGPLAFQRIFPPFISQCVLVLKNTTLASYIAVPEILYQGQRVSIETFRPLEILTAIALMFIIVVVPLTTVAGLLEGRLLRKYNR